MSKKGDYTSDEWQSITGAPYLAGLLNTMADPSGIGGVMKEALAVGRAVAAAGASEKTEVIQSLVEGLKAAGFSASHELPDVPRGDLASAKAAAFGHLDQAIAAISAKSPAEADAYKAWVLAAAKKVSEAAKEGGFLGFGGTLVSEKEQAALKELSDRLGLKA
jgi:hypothetical protein